MTTRPAVSLAVYGEPERGPIDAAPGRPEFFKRGGRA